MDPGSHLFWITSRAAGFTALLAASVAVGVGVASRPRGSLGSGRKADLKNFHEVLALTALAAIALHGLSLLGDGYLHPGPLGIAIPFAGPYRPLWTGLGIVGGYGLALLGLTYYARGRIGTARLGGRCTGLRPSSGGPQCCTRCSAGAIPLRRGS